MRRRWRAVVLSGLGLGWGALAARRWADAPVAPEPWTAPTPALTPPEPAALALAPALPPPRATPAAAAPPAPGPVPAPPRDDEEVALDEPVVSEPLAPPAPEVLERARPGRVPTPEERARALELLRRATEEGEAGIDTRNSGPTSEEERAAAEEVLEQAEGADLDAQFVEPPEEDEALAEPSEPPER